MSTKPTDQRPQPPINRARERVLAQVLADHPALDRDVAVAMLEEAGL